MSAKATLFATCLAGAAQILQAIEGWQLNPLRERACRVAWGPSPLSWLSLPLIAAVALGIALAGPHLPDPAGLLPPLVILHYVPGFVHLMLLSPSALFAYLVVWRLRRLRVAQSREGLDGGLCFDAVAVPVAAASLILVIALEALRFFVISPPESPSPPLDTIARSVGGGLRQLAGIAIIVGTLSSLRQLKSALGKILSATFFLLVAEWGLAFVTPWIGIGGWPGSGLVRPLAQALLYLAAVSILWAQSRAAWQGEESRGRIIVPDGRKSPTSEAPTPQGPPMPPPPAPRSDSSDPPR